MPRKGIRAVRGRLLFGLISLTLLAMAIIDVAALFVVDLYALNRVERTLTEVQRSLPIIGNRPINVEGVTLEQQLPEGFFASVVTEDRRVLTTAKANLLSGETITAPQIPDPLPAGWADRPVTVSSSDTQFRVQTFDLGTNAAINLPGTSVPVRFRYVIVGGSLGPGEDAVHQLLVFELIATGAAVVAVTVFGIHVLNRSLREQRNMETRLLEFLAAASHELRSPLTTIRGWAELQRVSGEPELAEKALSRIEKEATRMNSLVDQLLELSRLDLNRKFAREPVDIRRIAAELVADTSALMPDREITLDAPAETIIQGDETLLRHVLGNLMSNALRHTPDGTPITVSVHGNRLSVADKGPGMAPETAARVFERFYRAESRSGGSGLGLAIARGIVQAHGGDISVTTKLGEGSTFTVELPTVSSSSGK
ncbi:HAMP domain-containing histidine kinase [Kibdelosporangium philippinense]|uniref:histidine kinase n=1 Tax=Kibdelosporangium philippinense TaxID=211113 RepID=A0ABS8ZHI2_9PSEU|nr:HAMP domain-containing sensor histidine kinase [Kibdelosporangium philippinense]MCE7005943.1 HAMP domain-containing histidine kinase [Kibdelosporangium philippinense]